MAVGGTVLLVAACGGTTQGQAVSPLYDPFRVAGLPVENGKSGIRDDAPPPEGEVENGDGGEADTLALLSVNDLVDFWNENYSNTFDGQEFTPVQTLQSWDSDDPSNSEACNRDMYDAPNAMYCFKVDTMAWDRGVFVPTGVKFFGQVSIAGLIAHEYGHAVQFASGLVDRSTPPVVREQQADCFGGAYIRWVAEGSSKRFTMSTGDGLNYVIAGVITGADPILGPGDEDFIEGGHGTALDRVSAFQMGFSDGPDICKTIDIDEIEERRGDLPLSLPLDESTGEVATGELPITEENLQMLMGVLQNTFSPQEQPTLSFDQEQCDDAKPSPPVSYCPSSNTISVDLKGLEQLGQVADQRDETLVQGDNTALSVFISRYALALQKERGEPLDTPVAALRTACLTGVAQAAMAEPGNDITLTAGDLDEAVAGLLMNGLAASNVNGDTVPAGFTRIVAFRSGLAGDQDLCYKRFK